MPNTTKRSPSKSCDAQRLSDRFQSESALAEACRVYLTELALFSALPPMQAEIEAERLARWLVRGDVR